jgi:voltage-gated potassium channel
MNNTKHLIISILLMLIVSCFGTFGYVIIEGWDILDAFYMTVITLSTVGYGEVHQVSIMGRLFTILLVFIGVGFTLYVISAVVQFVLEGQIRKILGRRRLDKKIAKLRNHYIVCGYGRIGRVLCNILMEEPLDLVVIEKNEDRIPAMEMDKVSYISGDCIDRENIIKAGIKHAKGFIAALATDSDNVFLILTARQLNPDVYILARSSKNESKTILLSAGADYVESPYDIGAASLAQKIIRPEVTNFLNLALGSSRKNTIAMEEIPVSASSDMVDVPLKDSGIRQNFNLIIMAIKRKNKEMLFNPSHTTTIEQGDTIIAIGEYANLQKLAKVLNP